MSEISIVAIVVAVYFIGGYAMAPRLRATRFSKRSDEAYENIHREFFASKGVPEEIGRTLWLEAAQALRIPATKLRPSDRFDKELSYSLKIFPFVDLNDDFFATVVHRLKQRKLPSHVAKNWKTLGEYVVGLGVN
jgi:hypothetical protein